MRELIIVGAGLGEDSITLKGINAIKKADVILYDRLMNPRILDYASCELVDVGKIPYKACTRQSDINNIIKDRLSKDKVVVRLKGGDSTVFARSIEEISVAHALDAAVEVIPGVTSAATLSAKLQIALTDREKSSGVVFITGHTKSGELKDAYNWNALANLGLTLVVYMGIKNMSLLSGFLISEGMAESTPVLFGENLETDIERIFITTLGKAGETIIKNNIQHPATTIIGNILDMIPDNSFVVKNT